MKKTLIIISLILVSAFPVAQAATIYITPSTSTFSTFWDNVNNSLTNLNNGLAGVSVSTTTINSVSGPSFLFKTDGTITLSSSTNIFTWGFLNPGFITATSTAFAPSSTISSQWTTTSTGIFYNDGNVGIGTTTPGALLQVSGTGQILTLGNGTAATTYMNIAGTRAFVGLNNVTNNLALQGGFSGGTSRGIEFNVGNATFGSGQAMVINTLGNVGIGTTTPSSFLTVSGGNINLDTNYNLMWNGNTTRSISHDNAAMRFNNGGLSMRIDNFGANTRMTIGRDTISGNGTLNVIGNMSIGTSSPYLAEPPSYGLIVEGNVGIGTTAPSTPLHVIGTSTISNGNLKIASSTYGISFSDGSKQTTAIKTKERLFYLPTSTSATGDDFYMTFPTTSTLYRVYASHYKGFYATTSGSFANFNLTFDPNGETNTPTSSSWNVFSATQTNSNTTSTLYTSFASSTFNQGSTLRLITSNSSSTEFGIAIWYYEN